MTGYPLLRKYSIPFELRNVGALSEKLENFRIISESLKNAPEIFHKNLVKNLRKKWVSRPEPEEILREENLTHAYKYLESMSKLQLSELRKLHGLFSGKVNSEEFRQSPVFIRNAQNEVERQFPSYEDLDGLIMELTRWDAENGDITSAFILHFLILSIHPFSDGNGRVARAFEFARLRENGISLQRGWEPEVIMHWQAAQYNQVIEACRAAGAVDDFLEFMLEGYIDIGRGILRKFEEVE